MKTVIFPIRMPPKVRALLDQASATEQRPRSHIVAQLILERYDPEYRRSIVERLSAMGVA
jgi:hypothetical protein